MIFTARQLEELHRASGANGQLVLPYRARLSPLAMDWVKDKKITLGYSDDGGGKPVVAAPPAAAATGRPKPTLSPPPPVSGPIFYWADGPCGPAKAAVVQMEREAPLRSMLLPADKRWIVPVVKEIASEIKAGRIDAAVLLVQNAASVMVYANRCPSLRAVVGTCHEAVEQGVREVAANVLVIEHPHKTLPQVRSMLSRFVKANRQLNDEVRKQLEELASCS